jgi:hypothetical protein
MVSDFPNGFWLPQWFPIASMVSDCLNGFWLPQSFPPCHYDQRNWRRLYGFWLPLWHLQTLRFPETSRAR